MIGTIRLPIRRARWRTWFLPEHNVWIYAGPGARIGSKCMGREDNLPLVFKRIESMERAYQQEREALEEGLKHI